MFRSYRRRLQAKAKAVPGYRFYLLYDKLYRKDILAYAYRESIDRRWLGLRDEEMVQRINRQLAGWANYFSLGPVSKAYRAIDAYTATRLRKWLCWKHKVRNTGRTRFSHEYLYEQLGLIHLTRRTRHLPWNAGA